MNQVQSDQEVNVTCKAMLTMEFDRSDPDDMREFVLTAQAQRIASAVFAVDEGIRNRVKYTNLNGDAQRELDWVRSLIRDELGELAGVVLG